MSAEIKAAVEQAAQGMTTLHLKDGELRDAVAQFPTVASVGASTSFPHTMHVTITERLPVAFIKVGPRRTAVSADGYLLVGASFDPKHLPRIEGGHRPRAAPRRRRRGGGGHPRRHPARRFAIASPARAGTTRRAGWW